METVEVVIRISKEVYENIQKIDRIIVGRRNGKTIEFALWNGVKNGTVLPKGHGRLIDADALECKLSASEQDLYVKYTLEDDAPTVIEADREAENEQMR